MQRRFPPVSAAVNHTSFPSGDHARPPSVENSPASFVLLPARSTTGPQHSSVVPDHGVIQEAMRSPLGETRGLLIQPPVS